MAEDINKFYTVREFAKIFNVHKNTIYNSIKSGRIQAIQCSSARNSHYRIPDTELIRLPELDMTKTINKLVKERVNEVLAEMGIQNK